MKSMAILVLIIIGAVLEGYDGGHPGEMENHPDQHNQNVKWVDGCNNMR